jgi:pimeloyl-ACP methyl ester carboxylesterase
MAQTQATQQIGANRPFRVEVTDAELDDLRRRIRATRWPEQETVKGESQGVRLATMQELARYWGTDYDWRKCEAKLNALPQFITEIDGLDIHFIHVRSKHEDALPVIVTHGWPGSTIEQLKIIDPLTNPTAHGGSASDAFHVVIPSMPGFGFSGKPKATGWDPARIAHAWVELMKRLGYKQFVAQGGDWGALVTDLMAKQEAPELLAIHTNMPGVVPPDVSRAIQSGGPPPKGMSGEEQRAYERLKGFFTTNVAYALEMGTRPQALYGIADSPVGLAAWLIDHGGGDAPPAAASGGDVQPAAALAAAARTPTGNGHPATELTRDDILDNITFYWLTNSGVSSSRLYWENKVPLFDVKNVSIPTAVTVFPGELYQTPKSWTEKAYPKLIHYSRVDKGGHFAAWEQPEILASELRTAFKSFR